MKKLYTALLVAYFIIPSISLASIDTNLKYGARGVAVTELQDFLIAKGFLTGQTSGNFFSLTRKAVVAYQSSIGLPATGYVGPMTRAKINDDLSATNAPAVSAEIAETGTMTTQTNLPTSLASGCTSATGFSTTTGQSCSASTTIILPSGCSSAVGFSSTTGQSCLNATSATANKTLTLATGAVVEIDALGNIVRTITQAPQSLPPSTSTAQQQISQIQNSLNQIVQNTTPQPYSPPITSNIHVFSVGDGAVLTSCSIKENGTLSCVAELTLKYQTGKDTSSLSRPKGVSVSISVPSLGVSQTAITDDGNYGGDSRIYAIFKMPISKDGTYPLIFSANGASSNYNLVIDYIDRYKKSQCTENGTFCDLRDTAYTDMTPRIVKTLENNELQPDLTSQVIGEFKLEGITNSVVSSLKFDAVSAPLIFWAGYSRSALAGVNATGATFAERFLLSSGNNKITIKNQDILKPGTYTVSIKDVEAYGNESGTKKVFTGSPISFTFVVKDILQPEIIPIKTAHTYIQTSNPANLGVVGYFKIRTSPNLSIKVLCDSIRVSGGSSNTYIYAETTKGREPQCPTSWFGGETMIKEFPIGSDGISVYQYSLWVDTLTASSDKMSVNIDGLRVKNQASGLYYPILNPPTFELQRVLQ